jgi:hypothetical protein
MNDTWQALSREAGEVINSIYEASMQTASTNFAKLYVRVYVMQIARFFLRSFF